MISTTYEGVVKQGDVHLVSDTPLPEGARVLVVVLPYKEESYARRKANRWLAEYVGDMVIADQPLLTRAGPRPVWRFGAYVTSLHHDPFGPVGYVDVDVETGTVLADEATAKEIATHGEHLERSLSPAGK
jgi:hypothetical protein